MRVGFLLLVTLLGLTWSNGALAATNCTFRNVGRTLLLQSNCWTDATLTIPDGGTLDGRGRTITVVDPQGGHFIGAVVRNLGSTANVRNLTIEARGLANVCDSEGPPDQRLRGILFDGASGSITSNQIRNLGQVGSGCQEGNGIEVRGGPAGQGQAPVRVAITGNRVEGYQKTGVLVTGAVDVDIAFNRLAGLGPVDVIAQNGIQIAQGASGRIQWNRVEQNIYTGGDAASVGILVIGAGSPLEVERNRVEDNDIGIAVVSTSDTEVAWNEVIGSTFDGIAIDGRSSPAQGNQVAQNRLSENSVGVDLFGAGAAANEIVGNRIAESLQVGIQVALDAGGNVLEDNRLRRNANGALVLGDGNDILDNVILSSDGFGLYADGEDNDVQNNDVRGSGALDIENVGANAYDGNRCVTSSGTPVDCP